MHLRASTFCSWPSVRIKTLGGGSRDDNDTITNLQLANSNSDELIKANCTKYARLNNTRYYSKS